MPADFCSSVATKSHTEVTDSLGAKRAQHVAATILFHYVAKWQQVCFINTFQPNACMCEYACVCVYSHL